MKKNKTDHIFSKELRDHMAPFNKMGVTEAVSSDDFMRHLCKYAGMTDEEFDNILDEMRQD